jgi:chromosomal replication initiator protein
MVAVGAMARMAAPVEKDRSSYEKTRLIPTFTFDNLVVGKANDLARAAARQVRDQSWRSDLQPLVHLWRRWSRQDAPGARDRQPDSRTLPGKVVRYVHAEDYYSDVVRAYQQKSFDVFKRYYRSLDVLLLDDVQFFNGKNRTQEEFFYVFNALSETQRSRS